MAAIQRDSLKPPTPVTHRFRPQMSGALPREWKDQNASQSMRSRNVPNLDRTMSGWRAVVVLSIPPGRPSCFWAKISQALVVTVHVIVPYELPYRMPRHGNDMPRQDSVACRRASSLFLRSRESVQHIAHLRREIGTDERFPGHPRRDSQPRALSEGIAVSSAASSRRGIGRDSAREARNCNEEFARIDRFC
jgi:hypothetical protein